LCFMVPLHISMVKLDGKSSDAQIYNHIGQNVNANI
jgi:hypothetical protein